MVRTLAALHGALLDLASEDPAEIGVTALCEKSGLSRGTFYLHYSDVDALAADVAQTLVQEIVSAWREVSPEDAAEFSERSRRFLADYLRHVDSRRAFYSWVLSPTGNWQVIQSLLTDYAGAIGDGLHKAGRGGRLPHELLPSLLAGALFGVIVQWVTNPPRATADAVATWLWRELNLHPADDSR